MEGSGKSTLLSALARSFAERGIACVVTREPGGTPLGDRVRAIFVEAGMAVAPATEALLVNASRAQHVADVIEPALAGGRTVLCDRFSTATLAYQGFGRGIEIGALRRLAAFATGGREPDVILLVDVPVAISRARVAARARAGGGAIDRLEREDAAFHERVRDGYLQLAREDARFVVLDGTLPPDALAGAALAAIEAKLPA